MPIDERKQLLMQWLKGVLKTDKFSCEPASSDASFRRYFRVLVGDKSYIVMDAPPNKEDCTSFIAISDLLLANKVNAPAIFQQSLAQGFLLLSDFGSVNFLEALNDRTASRLYHDAVQVIHEMHQIPVQKKGLAEYNMVLLQQEMDLFSAWFVDELLAVKLSVKEADTLAAIQQKLADTAIQQPQVFVHRDYHSRNLMLTTVNNPGVIDFQDAVIGPMSYDLVSLYRDCYIEWPEQQVYAWLDEFLVQRQQRGCADTFSTSQFYQWFDWMGVQRHMKAIGIFSRLLLRDGKPGYLQDIPRTLNYVNNVCKRYDELQPLAQLIDEHQLMEKCLARIQAEKAV
ncbi:MAG: phosphotransferase [Cycloclasticus sp.]|nr:phosphotransferase [Cycloclasticus sp.]MBQ0790455.1 phosphotransferase [Cycloclasticus sp.]